jgi:uncharacterized protein (UPF0212 family)
MPRCPNCGEKVEGDFITARAAADIITQRDLLKVQKAELELKIERQAAWIEKLERIRDQLRHETRVLKDRLGAALGRTIFERQP